MVQPLLSPSPTHPGSPAPQTRRPGRRPPGRPPLDLRPVLETILWKISHQQPWYNLPGPDRLQPPVADAATAASATAPSWQTCYRYYRLWQRSGLLDQIYRVLYQDLVQRGGLDLPAALASGAISFDRHFGHWVLNVEPAWQDTWQLETARLFLALAAARLKSHRLPGRRRKRVLHY